MESDHSRLLPTFLCRLADPRIRTVLLCGCGGGFDFVHALLLYPELRRMGKTVVLGSYSFGDPREIGDPAPVFFERDAAMAKRVTAGSRPALDYCPEVHVASFLDERYPEEAPHVVYAYYARAFTVPVLRDLYELIARTHEVDGIVLVDGGSDSLMVGDEEGLGDPIEDCVSVTAVAGLSRIEAKILVNVGLGCDRFNHVSDAASLRAVAELSASGGFLGAVGLEPDGACFRFYRDCVDHVDARQPFRSVLAGAIISAGEGQFGSTLAPRLASRVVPGGVFLWPLMSTLWAFDVARVAERSLMSRWIRDAQTVAECHAAVEAGRAALPRIRPVENLPRHEAARGRSPGFFRERG